MDAAEAAKHKHAEEELRQSEEKYRLLALATKEVIWDCDLTTDEQKWDGEIEATFGYSRRQVTDAAWWEERIHPEDRERVLDKVNAALKPNGGEETTWLDEYRFRRADGTYATALDRAYIARDKVTGEPVRMVGSMADVTGMRRAEAALRESEEQHRTTFDSVPIGLARVAPDGRWLRVNDRLCSLSGYSREELLGMTFLDLTPPEDLEASRERGRRMLEGSLDPYSLERRYRRKDGSHVWVKLSVSLTCKASGEPYYFACIAEDITERKLSELVPDPLTNRELEVLKLVALCLTNPRIAGELNYSKSTIKASVQSIIVKLSVKDRREAAARAVEIGLIPPPCRPSR